MAVSTMVQSASKYAKLHMAIFALFGILFSGFDITAAQEIPITKVVVIVYTGGVMLYAFTLSLKTPAQNIEDLEADQLALYWRLHEKYGKSNDRPIEQEGPRVIPRETTSDCRIIKTTDTASVDGI